MGLIVYCGLYHLFQLHGLYSLHGLPSDFRCHLFKAAPLAIGFDHNQCLFKTPELGDVLEILRGLTPLMVAICRSDSVVELQRHIFKSRARLQTMDFSIKTYQVRVA